MTTRYIYTASQFGSSSWELQREQQKMLDVSMLAQSILGTTTQLYGLACTPTTIPSLSVIIEPGAIFKYTAIDATQYGVEPSIPADPNLILKYAYIYDPYTSLIFVPPGGGGTSRNDVVQFAFLEADGANETITLWGGVVYLTVNGTQVPIPNPAITTSVNTQRIDSIVISVKQGTPAPTGTQATPAPDAGFTGGWVVTTTNGDSTINVGDIALYPDAPFITESLTDKISLTSADARYARLEQVQYYAGVLNGGMSVARGVPYTLVNNVNSYATVDGFIGGVGGTATTAGILTQDINQNFSSTGNTLFFDGVTVTGSGVVTVIARMEALEAMNYINTSSSLSLSVSHDVGSNINYQITVSKCVVTNVFGALTELDQSGLISVASGVPTTISLTNITMADCSTGIEIEITAACGAVTTKDFHFANVQLNTGDFATTFVPPNYTETLQRCERYYKTSYEDGVVPGTAATFEGAIYGVSVNTTGAGSFYRTVEFPVAMVKIPTMTIYSPETGDTGKLNTATGGADVAVTVEGSSHKSFSVFNSAAITANVDSEFQYVADARL